jgi:hypothetical protein
MSLKVIGSGFGRTGTRSLKDALETLGFGPCHHMEEVLQNPPQVAHWQALAAGKAPDWTEVFKGYVSQIDWPGAHVWRETMAAFPDAKVVHSVRPDDKWWASFSGTIAKLLTIYPTLQVPPHVRDMMDAAIEVIGKGTFGGKWTDREAALAAYHKRLDEVRAAVPSHRLLVFDVAEGWEPLCRFLNVPVPAQPFPNRNQKDEFWQNLGGDPALRGL